MSSPMRAVCDARHQGVRTFVVRQCLRRHPELRRA